ncbi:MAG: AAA family ATPase [Leptolyngbyaceae cyanobacterium CRU_2_3]|nr:AAA family ATPase [Leptolyngbyaceae cyanobacterium CRU_2_3]
MTPHLIFLIGLPGSGKSFLAEQLTQQHLGQVLISTDAIRAKLFGNESIQGAWRPIHLEIQDQMRRAVQEISQVRSPIAPYGATYDATNTRRKNRRATLRLARSLGFRQITGIWVDTPLALCLERNRNRDRQVPEDVIQRMHRQLRSAPPSLSDGLDYLKRYTWTLSNERGTRDEA